MDWTPPLRNRLLELSTQDYSHPEIARVLSSELEVPITRDQVKNALARTKETAAFLAHKPVPEPTPYLAKYEAELKGAVTVAKTYPILENILSQTKRKILVLSDIHVPFESAENLQKAIDLNRTADILIIAGDFLDLYSCSRHRKKMNVQHEVELDRGVRVLEYLSEIFPWVFIVRGNHDERAMKQVRDRLPAELLYLVETEPLEYLTRPFKNVQFIPNWWVQIGDAIIAHQERSSTTEGKPGIYLMEYFLDKGWAGRLNLIPSPRVFVTGHTHQISSMYPRPGIKVFESGSITMTQDYTLDATAFMRPPMAGFVSLVQSGGVTDFNQSRESVL